MSLRICCLPWERLAAAVGIGFNEDISIEYQRLASKAKRGAVPAFQRQPVEFRCLGNTKGLVSCNNAHTTGSTCTATAALALYPNAVGECAIKQRLALYRGCRYVGRQKRDRSACGFHGLATVMTIGPAGSPLSG